MNCSILILASLLPAFLCIFSYHSLRKGTAALAISTNHLFLILGVFNHLYRCILWSELPLATLWDIIIQRATLLALSSQCLSTLDLVVSLLHLFLLFSFEQVQNLNADNYVASWWKCENCEDGSKKCVWDANLVSVLPRNWLWVLARGKHNFLIELVRISFIDLCHSVFNGTRAEVYVFLDSFRENLPPCKLNSLTASMLILSANFLNLSKNQN